MASSNEQDLQRIQSLINEQRELWYQLQRRIGVASGPLERSKLSIDLEDVNKEIKRLEEQYTATEVRRKSQPLANPVVESSATSTPKSTSNGSTLRPARLLRVFICHSSGDKPVVRKLYKRLQAEGTIEPWLDEEDLLPGQNWELQIKRAVRDTDIVLVCLSNDSISKIGFVNKEIKLALDEADKQPEDSIFVIPLKLEECKLPDRLSHLQAVNYFEERGYERLMRALQVGVDKLMSQA